MFAPNLFIEPKDIPPILPIHSKSINKELNVNMYKVTKNVEN